MSSYFERRLSVIDVAMTATSLESKAVETDEDDVEEEGELNYSEETFTINVLAETVESLRSIRTGLEGGTVCKAQAKELNAIHPTVLENVYSVESFTERPSKTNYTETLEGIGSSIKKAMKTAWEAIKKMLDKIMNHFFGNGSDVGGRAEEVKKAVGDDQQKYDKVASKLRDAVISSPTPKQFVPYEQYLEKVPELKKKYTQLLSDIFTDKDRTLAYFVEIMNDKGAGTLSDATAVIESISKGADTRPFEGPLFEHYDTLFRPQFGLDFAKVESSEQLVSNMELFKEYVGKLATTPAEFPFTDTDDLRLWVSDVNDKRWFTAHGKVKEKLEVLKDKLKRMKYDGDDPQTLKDLKDISSFIRVLTKQLSVNEVLINAIGQWNEHVFALSRDRIRAIKSTKV